MGVKQDTSLFYYSLNSEQVIYELTENETGTRTEACYSAFTGAELGVMLPHYSSLNDDGGWDH